MDKRTVLRRFTIAGFAGFTLIVVAVFVRQGWIAEVAREKVVHSHDERDQIQRVFSRIKDIELGQHGYALSGDSTYLAPYHEALHGRAAVSALATETARGLSERTLWDELKDLRDYFLDNPEQLARARELDALARIRVRYAEAVIHARSNAGPDSAVALIRTGQGKRIMDSTRALVAEMMARQDIYLADLTEEEDRNLHINSIMLYAVVILFYIAWLLSLRMAARSRRRRLKAERELRQSHSLLQSVVDSSTRGMFTTGTDGKILIYNPAAERMLGYAAKDILGRKASEAMRTIHEPMELERRRARLEERMGRPVRGLEIFELPLDLTGLPDPAWTLVRKDGSTFMAVLSISPLRGRDGVQFGHLVMFQDVTERRMMQRRLFESNAMFQAVIDGTNYAIFATDAEGCLTVFNRAAERMLGMKAEAAIGHPALELLRDLNPREIEERAARIFKKYGRHPEGVEVFTMALDEDQALGQEWTLKHEESGRDVPIMLAVSEMKDDHGRVIGYVALARDITELKANERLKKEFISTVSHELRTPLTSIRGALGLVAGGAAGPIADKAREMISIAHRNSERLVRIINDILDIDKIDAGNLVLHTCSVDAATLLHQAVEANALYGEKYSVRFVLGEIPPETDIEVDPDRLMQVMANLLSNAAKFSPQDAEVFITVKHMGGSLRVLVRDQGAGIPEAFRSRIFDKFAQAEGADSRRYEGTGLGLHITRKLIEAMGGTIGFTTGAGQGTTFHFDVPMAKPAAPAVAATASSSATIPAQTDVPRVLICEDDPDVGTLLRMLLERAGLAAVVVRTLAEARDRLTNENFAALTLDLILPDGSGLTLLRELRRDLATRDLPVIVISARAEEGRREMNGDAIGMIDWMTKPIDESQLQSSLERAFARSISGPDGMPVEGKPRVLHVEDDADFRHVLERSLGDAAKWTGAANLAEAEACLARGRYNLVVLDLDLPDGSGLALLERLKSYPGGPVPVLILSASETDDSVRQRVEAVLVKSRLSEERIVETILAQIRKSIPNQPHSNQKGPHT